MSKVTECHSWVMIRIKREVAKRLVHWHEARSSCTIPTLQTDWTWEKYLRGQHCRWGWWEVVTADILNIISSVKLLLGSIIQSWWWCSQVSGWVVNVTTESSIHSVFCLTTGPKPPLKRFLHIVRSRASSFNWQYPLLSLRSSSSFLRLLPRLLVTSISPFIFPSITCFRRQFLRKMWPTQLAFRFLISCRIFLRSLTLSNTSSFLTWSVQLIISILLQHHISKLSRYFWSADRSILAVINKFGCQAWEISCGTDREQQSRHGLQFTRTVWLK